VVDTSTVVVLARARRLPLLEQLCATVVLPAAVVEEILAGPSDDLARKAVADGWGCRPDPLEVPDQVASWGLGRGESSVLSEALCRPPATAILDDAQARRCARTLGIPVKGTLGICLLASRGGFVPSFIDLFEEIRAAGLYLDDQVIQALIAAER
jgi:predicted nucleic acid-binding protein